MYSKRHIYTEIELVQHNIADLETDHRCALRDGLPDYAADVAGQLDKERAKLAKLEPTPNT